MSTRALRGRRCRAALKTRASLPQGETAVVDRQHAGGTCRRVLHGLRCVPLVWRVDDMIMLVRALKC